MSDNLKLWEAVEKTDPKHTKKANIGGNKVTSIKPQYQIYNATKRWGSYGSKWGFKNIELDFSLINEKFYNNKTEGKYPNVKVIGKEESTVGLVVFKAIFFYPDGEFPAINSIGIFTNNERSKIDDDFAKKVETDSLTKCLSKLGFNADVFMGRFDDIRYVEDMKAEFKEPAPPAILSDKKITEIIKAGTQDKALAGIDTKTCTATDAQIKLLKA